VRLRVVVAATVVPIQERETQHTRALARQASVNLGADVLKVLLVDRGFLDGADLWVLKHQWASISWWWPRITCGLPAMPKGWDSKKPMQRPSFARNGEELSDGTRKVGSPRRSLSSWAWYPDGVFGPTPSKRGAAMPFSRSPDLYGAFSIARENSLTLQPGCL